VAVIVAVLALALWGYSGRQNQAGLGARQATVQSQLTAVAGPTPTATP
jgi:hypothetical protein